MTAQRREPPMEPGLACDWGGRRGPARSGQSTTTTTLHTIRSLVLKGIHRTMQRHTLYAYVDGTDLDDVAVAIERELVALADSSGWVASRPIVVNQKSMHAGSRPDDLPDWDLGVNLTLPEPEFEPTDWFADIERVVARLAQLHSKFGRDFVIGIADNASGVADELFHIESETTDLGKLRMLIGA